MTSSQEGISFGLFILDLPTDCAAVADTESYQSPVKTESKFFASWSCACHISSEPLPSFFVNCDCFILEHFVSAWPIALLNGLSWTDVILHRILPTLSQIVPVDQSELNLLQHPNWRFSCLICLGESLEVCLTRAFWNLFDQQCALLYSSVKQSFSKFENKPVFLYEATYVIIFLPC